MRFFIPVVFAVIGSPAMAANCSVDRYYFKFGVDTQTTMTVKAGTPCVSHINARSAVASSTISQVPSQGTAAVPENHSWSYKSRPGYTGKDAFVVELTGTSTSNNNARTMTGTTHIAVDVNVVP